MIIAFLLNPLFDSNGRAEYIEKHLELFLGFNATICDITFEAS